jgi:uncharacterized protein YvpB
MTDGPPITMPARLRRRVRSAGPRARLVRRFLAARAVVHGRRWRMRYAWSNTDVARVTRAARAAVGTVRVPGALSAASLGIRPIRQAYRNDCEATALSMLLGGRVSQYRLQALFPVAKPHLPIETDRGEEWGDPERGFVGSVQGGGYGIYERPVLAVARRFDPGALDLTGTSVRRVVAAVKQGRPVEAWIQFGASLPRTWLAPDGTTVHANFAEHTITLVGWRPGVLVYDNPWDGTASTITIPAFASVWRVLGDRAIAGSSMATGLEGEPNPAALMARGRGEPRPTRRLPSRSPSVGGGGAPIPGRRFRGSCREARGGSRG